MKCVVWRYHLENLGCSLCMRGEWDHFGEEWGCSFVGGIWRLGETGIKCVPTNTLSRTKEPIVLNTIFFLWIDAGLIG